jgi:hypothetical protein
MSIRPRPSDETWSPMNRTIVTPIACPECDQNGTATWEESADLAEGLKPKRVSTGFRISANDILFINCGVVAVPVSQTSNLEK